MGKNGKGNDKDKNTTNKTKLFELTALKNIDAEESKDRSAIWIKNWHLAYEIELRKVQVELMKLQKKYESRTAPACCSFLKDVTRLVKEAPSSDSSPHLNPRNTRVRSPDET